MGMAEMKQAFDKDDTSQRQDRLLTILEGLLELPATEVKATLDQATSLIAEVLAADKVDVFFHDPEVLTGLKVGLGVKSEIAVVFEVKTLHRGVLLAVSSAPEFFSEQDLHFLEAIAHWMGIVIQRAE